jgi:hypothetical protein
MKYDMFVGTSSDNRLDYNAKKVVQCLVQKGKLNRIIWVRTHFDLAINVCGICKYIYIHPSSGRLVQA